MEVGDSEDLLEEVEVVVAFQEVRITHREVHLFHMEVEAVQANLKSQELQWVVHPLKDHMDHQAVDTGQEDQEVTTIILLRSARGITDSSWEQILRATTQISSSSKMCLVTPVAALPSMLGSRYNNENGKQL